MKDNNKRNKQQITKLDQLRQRIAELERSNSELKGTEEALRESEAEFEAIFNDVRDGIILLDMTGKIVKINKRVTETTGYAEKDIVGKRFKSLKIFTPTSILKMVAGFKKTLAGKQSPYEVEGYTKTGEKRIAELHGSLLRKRGKAVGVVTVMRDSTERKRAEEAHRESEERFRRVVETMKVGLGAIDEKGVLTYVNEYFAKMLGYSIDEMIGRSTIEFYYDEESRKTQEKIFAKRRAGMRDTTPYEVIWRRKDGQKVYSILSPTPIFDADGRYTGSFAIHTDITERKKAETELRESEERHRTLFEHAGFAIELFEAETGKRVTFNAMAYKNLGYAREEFQDVPAADLTLHKDPKQTLERFKRITEKGPDLYEIQFKAKNGEIRDMLISAVPIRIHEKDYIHIIRVDITDQKRAQQALRESEERYRALYEDNPSMYFTVDAEGTVLSVNQFGAKQLGYEVKELVGKPMLNVFHKDEKEAVKQQLTRCIQHPSEVFHREFRKVRKDESILWVEETARAVRYAKDNLVVLIVCEDISKRRQTEEDLQESFERLSRSLESTVSALASALEMRDPYTAGHQQRATDLACAIAEEMGLAEERVYGIRLAGLIHDIGKINIPAEILNKPGQLTEIEYSLFKNHPQVGHDVLKTVDFPWPIAQIVLQHHERMDGSGYPQGLSGEEIMLEARILAVADIVEAIASHRPYRPARGTGDALEEILRNKGTLYDPEVVDACLRVFYEKGFTFERFLRVAKSVKIH